MGSTKAAIDGVDSSISESTDGRSPALDSVLKHPALTAHGNGIATEDLASFVEVFAGLAADRVRGTGADQYASEKQAFEDKSIDEIIEDLLEELLDVIAYTSFLAVKAGALR